MLDRLLALLKSLFPFLWKWPSPPMIVAALALAGIGYLLKTYGLLKPLTNLTSYLDKSLDSFSALSLGLTFYAELTGCEAHGRKVECQPFSSDFEALDRTRQGLPGSTWFTQLSTAIGNTISAVGHEATWFGIVIYLIALVIAGIWLAREMDLRETGPLGWLLWIVLTPAMASLAALGLKLVLMLLTLIFSEVLAGVTFLVGMFGGFIQQVAIAIGVLNRAHTLETIAEPSSPPPPPTAGDKPKK